MARFDLNLSDVINVKSNTVSTFSTKTQIRLKSTLKITKDPREKILKGLNETRVIFESRVTTELVAALDQAISSSIWSTNSGIADIVDSGSLRDSLNVSASNGTISIRYDEEYASFVHYGGYIAPYGNTNIKKIYIPPRPWVDAVLRTGGVVPVFDFEQIYKEAISQVLGI